MDISGLVGAIKAIGAIVGSARKVGDVLATGPSKQDRQTLIAYTRRLDERRAFYAPYNVEVVECCLASLSTMKDATEEALAKLDHDASRAAVGAILDQSRSFLDKWHGFQTPHEFRSRHRPVDFAERHGDRRQEAEFFEDLGELRVAVRLMVEMISELEPRAQAPNLTKTGRTTDDQS